LRDGWHQRTSWAAPALLVCFFVTHHSDAAAGERANPEPAVEAVKAVVQTGGKAVCVTFADGHRLVVRVDESQDNFEKPVISRDRRTVAFAEEIFLDSDYQVPALVFVYRDGKKVRLKGPDGKPDELECFNGGVSLNWALLDRGRRLYLDCGFEHGRTHEYRNLFDLTNGRLLETVQVDDDTGRPPANAPDWAR
jgi:SAM-dependent methyltransferase